MFSLIALVPLGLCAVAVACGGSEDAPQGCEGAACIDGGDSESSTPEGSTTDGPLGDAPSDSPNESGDAGACTLEAPDADAAPSGTLQWALNFGVSGYTYPTTVARDPVNGDIVVTGYFWGTTDFGGGALTSVAANDGSGSDVFVARFEKSGAYKWANAWGNGSNVAANTVAIGPVGEMVFAGLLREGSLDFGCGPIASGGTPNMFVVKLAKTGACEWSKGFGTAGVNAVAIDGTGSVLVAGATPGGVDFGGGVLSGFYLTKLAANGAHRWSKSFPASTAYGGPWLSLDRDGNAVFGGSFSKSINLGGGPLVTAGAGANDTTNAAFAAKFDPTGQHLWSHQYGEGIAGKNVSVSGVATDACGSIILHGPFAGAVNFGTGTLTASDTSKSYAFLAKLTATGTATWSKTLVGSNGGNGYAFGLGGLAVDSTGGATIAPALPGGVGFQSTTDFGGGPLTGSTGTGASSISIATFDSTAKHRWSHVAAAPSTARASAAAFPLGVATWGSSTIVTGTFTTCSTVCPTSPAGTTLVLAGKELTAVSGQDLFIASFSP